MFENKNRSTIVRCCAHIDVGVTLLAGLALLAAVVALPRQGSAQQASETEVFVISRGGQIYDNWMSALEADKPAETHPAYPAEGKKKGASTWRCKECHGWDYKGADGAYGKGSHYTGIKGIRNWVGREAQKVEAILRNETHAYTKQMLSDSAVEKLALFVTRGQIDMDQHIDRGTKKARADVDRGARFYQTVCAICHGFDGTLINFKDEAKPEFVGTVAVENPWEALHKIRNGQPGVAMVAMNALSVEDQVDILAYCQTLPTK
jgi:thiosulfate dehydrogenase